MVFAQIRERDRKCDCETFVRRRDETVVSISTSASGERTVFSFFFFFFFSALPCKSPRSLSFRAEFCM